MIFFLVLAAVSATLDEATLNVIAPRHHERTENVTVTVSPDRTALRIMRPNVERPINCVRLMRENNTVDVYGDYDDDDAEYHCVIHFHPDGSLDVDSGVVYDRALHVMFHLFGTQLTIPHEIEANARRALAGSYQRLSCFQRTRKTIRVASTGDRAWCAKYYGVSQRCRETIITYINMASLVYINQFNIALRPELVLLPGDPGARNVRESYFLERLDSKNNGDCNVHIIDQLEQLKKFALAYRRNDQFGLWHHFTGCRTKGILGRAFSGGLCSTAHSGGVSTWTEDVREVVYTVAHEMGHVLGARHTESSNTHFITIMDKRSTDILSKAEQDTPVQFTSQNGVDMCGIILARLSTYGSSNSETNNHVPGNKCWGPNSRDPKVPDELDPGIGTNVDTEMIIFGIRVNTISFYLIVVASVLCCIICCVIAGCKMLYNISSSSFFGGKKSSRRGNARPKQAQRSSVQRLAVPSGQTKTLVRGDTATNYNNNACRTNDNVTAKSESEERSDAPTESPANANRIFLPQVKGPGSPQYKLESPQPASPRLKQEAPQTGSPPQPGSPSLKKEAPQPGSPREKPVTTKARQAPKPPFKRQNQKVMGVQVLKKETPTKKPVLRRE
eukprot:GEMP01012670.1.p1 GENE.GEMP01012670.1~~GEMP01012670.1.p1  ORF type:complete len:616 (+),score=104.10 GEMP01012670.1:207-2054(+)